MHLLRITTSTFIVLALVTAGGCGSKQKASSTASTGAARKTNDAPRPKAPDNREDGGSAGVQHDGKMVSFSPVYFDFDSAVIKADSRQTLDDMAAYLQKNPRATLLVEGHCDERGTTEYNIGLGERRAEAIRAYLVRMGVTKARISTISYGKERPAREGNDEMAWSKNRRGELVPGDARN